MSSFNAGLGYTVAASFFQLHLNSFLIMTIIIVILLGNVQACLCRKRNKKKTTTSRQKQREGFSLRDTGDKAHIWHLFPFCNFAKTFSKDTEENFGATCLSSTSLLQQEGREKQIMNLNAQKHKAVQWQLPRAAWHS